MHSLAIPFQKVKGWQFWYDRKWQYSSILNIVMWVIGTKIIFHFEHWGPGWLVIITVGLCADSVMWAAKKLLVWTKRKVELPESVGRSWIIWGLFAGVNLLMLLALNTAADISTHHTRYIMVPFGFLINPVRYHLDNKVIYGDVSLPELGHEIRHRAEQEASNAFLYVRGWTRMLM